MSNEIQLHANSTTDRNDRRAAAALLPRHFVTELFPTVCESLSMVPVASTEAVFVASRISKRILGGRQVPKEPLVYVVVLRER